MKNLLLAFAILVTIYGCSTGTKQYIAVYDFPHTQSFNKPFEDVWKSVIDWTHKYNIDITAIDKKAGTMVCEYKFVPGDNEQSYCDCGKEHDYSRYSGMYEIHIKDSAGVKSSVFIESTFRSHYSVMSFPNNKDELMSCNSTGKIEKSLFDYIIQN